MFAFLPQMWLLQLMLLLQLLHNFTAMAQNSVGHPSRIIGGKLVPEGKYPFMAHIVSNKGGICGSTILNEDTLLTAAHCVVSRPSPDTRADEGSKNIWVAYIGLANLTRLDDASEKQKSAHEVKISYAHPSFKRSLQGYDVAIVKLARKIKFDSKLNTGKVCLPRATDKPDVNCVAMGWGRIDPNKTNSYPWQLYETDLTMQPHAKCNAEFEKNTEPSMSLNPGIICASGGGSKSVCSGDSGGPLLCGIAKRGESKKDLYQFGITSFAMKGCIRGFNYFTNVGNFTEWIRERAEKDVA